MSLFEDVKRTLQARGWGKGDYTLDDGGHCLVGAYLHQEGRFIETDKDLAPLVEVIHEQYPDRVSPTCRGEDAVISFNDHPDTTWSDVERVLEKAAINA